MAIQKITQMVAVMAVAGFGTATVQAHDDHATSVVYKGDPSAREVCMSIVRDDVDGLRDAFHRERSQLFERSHLAYECNSMALDEFALTQDAESVSEYLAPRFGREGTVTVEQVVSIEN
jgi:hypothetical protein